MTWGPINNSQGTSVMLPIPNAQGGSTIAWTVLIDNVGQIVFTNTAGFPLSWVGTGVNWAPINNTQ